MNIIEICSYPKSGNTWLRNLIYQFQISAGSQKPQISKDIHGEKDEILADLSNNNGIDFPNIDDLSYFYKSHTIDNSIIDPNKIIYIYRHPLDVLLSTINWFYIKHQKDSQQFSKQRLKKLFMKGTPKRCEEIYRDGELQYYLDKFQDDFGIDFHPGMLGKTSNYFTHVESALSNSKVIAIKYEDLIDDASGAVSSVMGSMLNKDFSELRLDTQAVDNKTKNRGGPFYWKAKSGTRYDFFTEEQIYNFETINADKLKKIGYL